MMWALCNGSWCSMFWRLPMFIGLCVGQFVFLRTKRYSTSVDTLIVKTIEYGLLKTHVHCMKILCIRHRLVFGKRCLENKSLDDSYLKRQLLRKFTKMGRPPLLRKQQFSYRTSCRAWDFGHRGPQT